MESARFPETDVKDAGRIGRTALFGWARRSTRVSPFSEPPRKRQKVRSTSAATTSFTTMVSRHTDDDVALERAGVV